MEFAALAVRSLPARGGWTRSGRVGRTRHASDDYQWQLLPTPALRADPPLAGREDTARVCRCFNLNRTHSLGEHDSTQNPRPDRRRRAGRPGARRRARLARRRLPAGRAERRHHRHAEDERGERPHHGVLPALGHRRPGAQLPVPARPRPRRGVRHELHRLRARPHSAARGRGRQARAVEPDAAADLLADVVRSDPARFRAVVAVRRAAPPHPARIASRTPARASSPRSSISKPASARRIEADYLVGCDGATSAIRGQLGIGLDRAGRARPSGASVLPRAGFPQARRQGGGHVLPRHRPRRAVGQHPRRRSGQRHVAADGDRQRRQADAGEHRQGRADPPRRRPAVRRRVARLQHLDAAQPRRGALFARAACSSPATPCTSSRRPARWA